MTTAGGARFFRENAFLVAAVVLPLLVVGLFLAATAIPNWFVAPPAYDLLLSAQGSYQQAHRQLIVGIEVREGRAEATIQRSATGIPPGPRLFLFEHETRQVREVLLAHTIPPLEEGNPPVRMPIPGVSDRRILVDPKAPDGYEFQSGYGRGGSIVGELFGMGRRPRMSLVKDGRSVPIALPGGEYWYGLTPVGWLLEEGAR